MPSRLAKALCASVAALTTLTAAIPAPAFADAMLSESAPSRVISVPKDKSLSFRLDEPATKIVVAQPDIAEVVATTDRSFYVRGVSPGTTNLLVYGPGGRLMDVIDVNVGYDGATLQRDIATVLPGEDIHVKNLGQGIILTGYASTTSVAARALAMAQKFAPEAASSSLLVRASSEVVLEVRIMEAGRSALQDIGFSGAVSSRNTTANWGSGLIGNVPANGIIGWTNHLGSVTVNANIEALEEKGVVHTLAKPNLVAVSGGKASFLAGGEFPYPVPQNAAPGSNSSLITIAFREYGVKLNFSPTVQDNGFIRLNIAPEVSQLDQANAIKIGGVQIPGLIERKTDTTVEMRDGDALAISGLFQHTYTNDLRQFPVLGSIPILGSLFRSARWNKGETELVIIVTPHLATPQDFDHAKRTVSMGEKEPNPFDFVVKGEAFEHPMGREMRSYGDDPGNQGTPPAKAAAIASAPAAKAPFVAAQAAQAPAKPAPVVTASLVAPVAKAAPAVAAPVKAEPAKPVPVAPAPVTVATAKAAAAPAVTPPAPTPAKPAAAPSAPVAVASIKAAPAPSAPVAVATAKAVSPPAPAPAKPAATPSAPVTVATVKAAPAPSAPAAVVTTKAPAAATAPAPVSVTPIATATVAPTLVAATSLRATPIPAPFTVAPAFEPVSTNSAPTPDTPIATAPAAAAVGKPASATTDASLELRGEIVPKALSTGK